MTFPPVTMGTYFVNRFSNSCSERLQTDNMFSSDLASNFDVPSDLDELIKSYESEEKFLNNKLQQL